MSFQVGQTIVHRDVHRDGRILSAGAARVLADDANGVLTWIAEGSQVMYQTTFAGQRTRAYPFDGSLTDFKPEPEWEPATLPPRWDQPVSGDLPAIDV